MNNTYNTRKILVIIRNPMGISVPLIRAPQVRRLKRELKAMKQELSATVEPLKEKLRFANGLIQRMTEHFTDNVRTLDYFWEKFYQRGAQENQERSQERGR